MNSEILKLKTFRRRAFILGGVKIGAFALLLARLYSLQVVKHKQYFTLSLKNKTREIPIIAPRGTIFDCNNVVMASNENYFRSIIDISEKDKYEPIIRKTAKILELGNDEVEQILKNIKKQSIESKVAILYKKLNYQDIANLEFYSPELYGLEIDIGIVRSYHLSNSSSHLLGYINTPTKKDIPNNENPIYKNPDYKIGKEGIEKYFDQHLQGRHGIKQVEVNAMGVTITQNIVEDSVKGNDLHLSINSKVQNFADLIMQGKAGSITVVNIETGELICMYSAPTYDPNLLSRGVTNKEWQELISNPQKPLINRALSYSYSPGSAFKIVSALAGLEDGKDPEARLHCSGYITFGNRRFHCWKEDGHGPVNMQQAIAMSCNCYFYNLARTTSIESIYDVGSRLGLGKTYETLMFNQNKGLIPDKAWKQHRLKQSWTEGDNLNTIIGQGYVQTSMLQLAIMTARVANNGKEVSPTILLQRQVDKALSGTSESAETALGGNLGFKQEHLDIVKSGLFSVVNSPYGTAYARRISDPKKLMCGKTGSVQIISRRFTKAEIAAGKMPEEFKNHGIFVAYAPHNNPKFAASVLVEHGGGGAVSAAPIASLILEYVQDIYSGIQSPAVEKRVLEAIAAQKQKEDEQV